MFRSIVDVTGTEANQSRILETSPGRFSTTVFPLRFSVKLHNLAKKAYLKPADQPVAPVENEVQKKTEQILLEKERK